MMPPSIVNNPEPCPPALNPDGSLSPFSDMVPATGEVGPHRNQTGAGPHPHYVSFDPSGRFLVAPDRGTDRVLVYRLNAAGKLVAAEA
jgi:6-phosphogluconolactonase (cycloisomerase 2 family)